MLAISFIITATHMTKLSPYIFNNKLFFKLFFKLFTRVKVSFY